MTHVLPRNIDNKNPNCQTKSLIHKLIRMLLFFVGGGILFVALIIIIISPITKYAIEKYDVKYTGREIKLDWAYVNPFNGYIHLRNLKIFELNSDSVFFSAVGVNANLALLKMFFGTYEVSELTLNRPRGLIIQTHHDLNFSDLIDRFSSKKATSKLNKKLHFNILRINIHEGEFYYRETVTPINYFITKVNIESSGLHWDADTIAAKFSLVSGIAGGGMHGNFTINYNTLDYRLGFVASQFNLNILDQYLKDLSNYGYFAANFDANMKVKGNFKEAENVTFSGTLAVNDFHVGEKQGKDLASFKNVSLGIFELSPKRHIYLFDSVSITDPCLKYEQYDYLDNIQRMFLSESSNEPGLVAAAVKNNLILIIGQYIVDLSRNFLRSNYTVNRLAIYNGDFEYTDYSISEKFHVQMNPLFLFADSIDKKYKRVNIKAYSGIKPFGKARIALSMNPNDSSDFDLEYHLLKLPVSMFNPYLITYTSFPMDRGTIEINGVWNVKNGFIKSNNHIVIIDPRLTKRITINDLNRIPMKLILAFARERGNVIDYEIPITGDLKDPLFHLRDALNDVLKNIFVKPPTTPYRMQVKNSEKEIENTLSLKWEMRQSSLRPAQQRFLERIADFLANTPEASISVSSLHYEIKEKEYILLYEAKKRYFLGKNNKKVLSMTDKDVERIEKMSSKDKQFEAYLNTENSDSMLFTIQDKCIRLLGVDFINARYGQLTKERKMSFLKYFKDRGVEKQVHFSSVESIIPYNGFSFFEIEYKGDSPDKLSKAYRKMNELNDKSPRNKFKRERKKTRLLL